MVFAIGLLGYLLIGLFLPTVSGQMSNTKYIIKTQELDTNPNLPSNNETSTPLNPNISEGVNFRVKTGFENKQSLPLSVSLSSDSVDFGTLSPTNPIIRTVNLSVNGSPTFGYSIISSENNPLKNNPDASGEIIPNATCDNGECSHESAGEWINTLTYGFGYRCDNITGFDCDNSFFNANFYKHFPDISNSNPPQSVMSGIGSEKKDVRLSYKINISGNQAQGTYTNTITFIAIPNF